MQEYLKARHTDITNLKIKIQDAKRLEEILRRRAFQEKDRLIVLKNDIDHHKQNARHWKGVPDEACQLQFKEDLERLDLEKKMFENESLRDDEVVAHLQECIPKMEKQLKEFECEWVKLTFMSDMSVHDELYPLIKNNN